MSDATKDWTEPVMPEVFKKPIAELPRDLQKLVQAAMAYKDGVAGFIALAEDCVNCDKDDCYSCPTHRVLQDSALFVTTSFLGVRKRQVAPQNKELGDEIMDWVNAWTGIALRVSRSGSCNVRLFG